MRLLVTAMVVSFAGCSKKPAEAPKPIAGALHQQTCGDVTAAWIGKRDDGPGPDWFFTDHLEFHFAGGAVVPFKETGELYPHNRSFDIFSPDCAWVLLPQDNYGPYHLVKVSELQGYLRGTVKAREVTGGKGMVLTDQRWVSPTKLEFFASCCGGVEVYRASIDRAAERVFFAAAAPHGIRRTDDGGYEVAP